MLKLALSTTPLSFDAPSRGTPANIRTYLIFSELSVYIFAADSLCLLLLLFSFHAIIFEIRTLWVWFWKSWHENRVWREIANQGHSSLLVPGHSFCNQLQAGKGLLNAGPISKVSEEVATEIAENCRRRQLHCRLTSPTRIIGQHFCCWFSPWNYFRSILITVPQ